MAVAQPNPVLEFSDLLAAGPMADEREQQRIAIEDGPRTALVVEEDLKAAALIRTRLEALGFTVLHVVSAKAALALAVRQPLSLITLGIILSDMDGCDFLARLRQIPGFNSVPVVIISIMSREAIVIARQALPDLIVLDSIMPRRNGFDVVHAIQPVAGAMQVPIFAVIASQS